MKLLDVFKEDKEIQIKSFFPALAKHLKYDPSICPYLILDKLVEEGLTLHYATEGYVFDNALVDDVRVAISKAKKADSIREETALVRVAIAPNNTIISDRHTHEQIASMYVRRKDVKQLYCHIFQVEEYPWENNISDEVFEKICRHGEVVEEIESWKSIRRLPSDKQETNHQTELKIEELEKEKEEIALWIKRYFDKDEEMEDITRNVVAKQTIEELSDDVETTARLGDWFGCFNELEKKLQKISIALKSIPNTDPDHFPKLQMGEKRLELIYQEISNHISASPLKDEIASWDKMSVRIMDAIRDIEITNNKNQLMDEVLKVFSSEEMCVDNENSTNNSIYDSLRERLEEIATIKESGSGKKMECHNLAICAVLDAVSKVDGQFDPSDMPGVSNDFEQFCHKFKELYSFPYKSHFKKIAKGGHPDCGDRVPNCNWQKRKKSAEMYWSNIQALMNK